MNSAVISVISVEKEAIPHTFTFLVWSRVQSRGYFKSMEELGWELHYLVDECMYFIFLLSLKYGENTLSWMFLSRASRQAVRQDSQVPSSLPRSPWQYFFHARFRRSQWR